MKRRDRPFNHTPECNEKQADFRARLRKMEMLPLDGTSSVLDPSIGITPSLPITSVIAVLIPRQGDGGSGSSNHLSKTPQAALSVDTDWE